MVNTALFALERSGFGSIDQSGVAWVILEKGSDHAET